MLVRKVELYRHIPYSDTIWFFDLTQIAKPSVNGGQFLIDLDRPNINKLRFIYGSDIDLPHSLPSMFSCMFVEHGEFFFYSRGHAFCTISLNHVYPSLQGFAIDGTGGLSNSIPLRINEQRCRERIHSIGRGRIGIQVIEHRERVTFLLDKR